MNGLIQELSCNLLPEMRGRSLSRSIPLGFWLPTWRKYLVNGMRKPEGSKGIGLSVETTQLLG
jgi:hypothetical protein